MEFGTHHITMKLKKLFIVIIIFIIGGLGGVLIPNVILPFVKLGKDRAVIINKTEQVVISRQTAVEKAYQKNIASLVSTVSLNKSVATRGFGFIVSSDGLILTRREWMPLGGGSISVVRDNDTFPAEVLKRSDDDGLVLLKINASNLPVVSFSAPEDQPLGADLFLIGVKQGFSGAVRFIDMGILKSKDGSILETDIKEDLKLATGTPLLNLNGDVVGINSVDSSGYVFAISANVIKKFIQ